MLVSDYDYDLPEERIAKFPPKERGATRLLVLNRETGKIIDSFYRNLDEFLNPGDVLILNDTRVMQSRLFCELPDDFSMSMMSDYPTLQIVQRYCLLKFFRLFLS